MRKISLALPAALLGTALVVLGADPPAVDGRQGPAEPASGGWPEVERLIGEQKLAAAAQRVAAIEAAARARSDDADLARAIVRSAQLGLALGGYETTVESLRSKPWPEEPVARASVELYDAYALSAYLDAYSWEIRQRERVVANGDLDLKLWTRDQIVAEADHDFAQVWARREALGGLPNSAFDLLVPNTFPARIRPTVRDAISYLWADRLSDSSGWSPAELQELWRLDLGALVDGKVLEPTSAQLADASIHPLARLATILGDLERWHLARNESGAALEARLVRLRTLFDAFGEPEDRARIRQALADSLPEFRREPWWAMGMARLAAFWHQSDAEPEALIRARAIALEGEQAFPASPGAAACRREREEIEAPDYSLQAKRADGPGQRSIELRHRNLARLYLRAYRLEPPPFDQQKVEWRGWNEDRIRTVLRQRPVASWTVELPSTPDFRDHRTFTTPPLTALGHYLIVASAEPGFAARSNLRRAVELRLSDIVLLHDRTVGETSGHLAVRALSGRSGAPLAGADAALYRWQWQQLPQLVSSRPTDGDGFVEFGVSGDAGRGGGFAVVVRRAGAGANYRADEAVWQEGYWPWQASPVDEQRVGTLLFTDRAVYRPGQKLLWKSLTYEGKRRDGDFRAVSGRVVTVRLLDPNRESVAEQAVATNSFGTASGAIEIPAGRLLGQWTLETDAGGASSISVEEYKRPTFEVTLAAASGEPRLNRPVEMVGEARYYFGLPVSSGRVAWRVVREPLWEWGRGGFGRWWAPPAPPRTIASGTAEPDADGRFTVRFTPAADERERTGCGCFRFRVEADLTDDGGETRSASRSIPLGWVGVRLAVEGDPFLVSADADRHWSLRREALDGEGRGGATTWRIVEIAQPESAPLPAELPQRIDPALERFATPGDRLSPRWATAPETETIVGAWPEGREVAHGELTHPADGSATLVLPELTAGVYRLLAETRDEHGEVAHLEQSFVIPGASREDSVGPEVPLDLRFERPEVAVGGTARLFVHSGLPGQTIVLEIARKGEVVDRRLVIAGRDPQWLDLPVSRSDRGGFGARAVIVADHQVVQREAAVTVPWDDKGLTVELSTFRDRLEPGRSETWRVTVKDPAGEPLGADAAELLASMYDRSLDLFRRHEVPLGSSIYPTFGTPGAFDHDLGGAGAVWSDGREWIRWTSPPSFRPDSFAAIDPYGVGGPGGAPLRRMARGAVAESMAPAAAPQQALQDGIAEERSASSGLKKASEALIDRVAAGGRDPSRDGRGALPVAPRADFSETAFWRPNLVTDSSGSASIEFRVPDSLTAWTFWVSAWTRELASGYVEREVRTAKELMVRPYLPRFLREGDTAELRVAVDNAADHDLTGEVRFGIFDPETNTDLSADFGLPAGGGRADFSTPRGKGANLRFPIVVPRGVRPLAFRVEARSGSLSDGELRPLPVLPSRIRLSQSRFAAIKNGERRELTFDDMRDADPTRIDEQLVVTVDGQLFYGMLDALPYLVDYPYECTEQTMNRFVSTSILGSLFDRYPSVAKMTESLAKRETRWQRFDASDPNRRMALEETPWLRQSRGGTGEDEALLRVLDPTVSRLQRADALAKLERAQLPSGAFPWFPGGPPSPFVTLYLMSGFARVAEFGGEIPLEVVRQGWRYLANEIEHDWWKNAVKGDCCWELLTFANYVASSYPDPSVMGEVFPAGRRRELLDFSFEHWKQHAPQSKLQLALTLQRMQRPEDARLVLESVLDSAKSDRDLGTYWAPEDRAWLWYNDTIETHAWALRALTELAPRDPRREGLVQWLFVNKQLGHWKSTRATAEVLYSLARYLESERLLDSREQIDVTVGGRTTDFVFEPDHFTGRKNRIVLTGDEIVPQRDATTLVVPKTKALAFASATWQFSTETLPTAARGDLFHVERSWFHRVKQGKETTLVPLSGGEPLAVGDELEVQLAIRANAAAEYVHLRDPRPAGLEPDRSDSGWRWDLGLAYYEETRDSGSNFFFERLPAGEYTLRYRLRANLAGTFRAAPAQLDSMYAPEFVAYSAGEKLTIAP